MKVIKFVLKLLAFSLLTIVTIFGIFLIYATITEYQPEEHITLFESSSPDTLRNDQVMFALTWNIGYAGLGENMDFFYDGGAQVRDTKDRTLENLNQIKATLRQYDSIPFLLLQEVDQESKRTYKINMVSELSDNLAYPYHFFATNYKSFFVPMPPVNPMGKVLSGLVSFSKYEPVRVERIDYPGSYSWPTKLFMLDRCFMVMRFVMENGNQLLVINTHNSAFDGGVLKKEEMAFLKEFLLKEYEQGHHVLVGGDWNQNPPGFEDPGFNENSGYDNFILNRIDFDFLAPDWTWHFDPEHPTNRALVKPYNQNTSTTILDFFLTSPNIRGFTSQTLNLNFQNSDHHPVLVRFIIAQD